MLFKKLLAFSLLSITCSVSAVNIHGGGATFPALVSQKWAKNYSVHKGLQVDYLAVGS